MTLSTGPPQPIQDHCSAWKPGQKIQYLASSVALQNTVESLQCDSNPIRCSLAIVLLPLNFYGLGPFRALRLCPRRLGRTAQVLRGSMVKYYSIAWAMGSFHVCKCMQTCGLVLTLELCATSGMGRGGQLAWHVWTEMLVPEPWPGPWRQALLHCRASCRHTRSNVHTRWAIPCNPIISNSAGDVATDAANL